MPTPDWSTPWRQGKLGLCFNALIEARLHVVRLTQFTRQNRLVVFPCGDELSNPASLLRAYGIGRELRKYYGWRVTVVPPRLSLAQRRRIVAFEKPDLILMQMERHPLNRPRLYRPYPVIFDIDDADYLWEHAREIVRECFRESAGVTAGSRFVADHASKINSNVEVIWTGGPALKTMGGLPQSERGNIVAWGHSRPLDYPAEAEFIQSVLVEVHSRTPVEYWIFGCRSDQDHSRLADKLTACGVKVRFIYTMSNEEFTQRLGEVAIGLQVLSDRNEFSRGKSFGKILNYLCAGVVAVASNAADHPLFFKSGENGYLAGDQSEWIDAISDLLKDPIKRSKLSVKAFEDYKKHLTVMAAAAKYDTFFRKVILKRGHVAERVSG